MNFKTILLAASLLALPFSLSSCKGEDPLSMQVVKSEMARWPEPFEIDWSRGRINWNYTPGLEMKSFLDVYDRYGNDTIFRYVDKWYDTAIAEDGSITNYDLAKYSTDLVCPANTLFYLYDKTGKEKYRKAMDTVRKQLDTHPRTKEGGFWHKLRYTEQMWLDGLYMAQPFYAQYTQRYEPEATKAACFEDIMHQFITVAKYTYDPATKLYRHAWDSSHQMFWCDPETGQSKHAWGRALGWYCMGIVETLPYVPENTPGRDSVIAILNGIFEVLPQYADPQTGTWYQVLDQPGREGNYVEATCTAMFTYAMLKGIRLGYLPASMKEYAVKCYENLLKTFVVKNEDGTVSLTRCCAVAGLGGDGNRSGDYDYYIHEKIRDNDPKGIGPLIWASLEMDN